MTISYFVGNSLYLNITNKCTNDCVFCIRNFGDSLKLETDPPPEEIWNDIVQVRLNFDEIVFCGFGEPTIRLDDVILPLSKRLKETFSRPIRLNTNGHAGMLHPKRNIAKELADSGIDKVSISLNAEEAWLYNFLCKPKFIRNINDESVYRKLIQFIQECQRQEGLITEVTVLRFPIEKMPEGIPPPDIERCKATADRLNVSFRVREYFGPHLYASILRKYSG